MKASTPFKPLPARIGALILLVALCLLAFAVAVSFGSGGLNLRTVWGILLSRIPFIGNHLVMTSFDPNQELAILAFRLPRVLLTLLAGASLGFAGAIMQALFRNPMAEPYLLGVSSGAALGATLSIILGLNVAFLGVSATPLAAFLGAAVVTGLVYAIGMRSKAVMTTLLLTGIAIGAFIAAINSLLMILMRQDLWSLIFWLMGGFSLRGWSELKMALPYAILGLLIGLFFAKDLNALALSDEEAAQLGVRVSRARGWQLLAASLLAATAVSVGGIIGFVGLIVPHVARAFAGHDHRLVLPFSALLGAAVLTISDLVARTIFPQELPVGAITAILGAPFFIAILLKSTSKTLA